MFGALSRGTFAGHFFFGGTFFGGTFFGALSRGTFFLGVGGGEARSRGTFSGALSGALFFVGHFFRGHFFFRHMNSDTLPRTFQNTFPQHIFEHFIFLGHVFITFFRDMFSMGGEATFAGHFLWCSFLGALCSGTCFEILFRGCFRTLFHNMFSNIFYHFLESLVCHFVRGHLIVGRGGALLRGTFCGALFRGHFFFKRIFLRYSSANVAENFTTTLFRTLFLLIFFCKTILWGTFW